MEMLIIYDNIVSMCEHLSSFVQRETFFYINTSTLEPRTVNKILRVFRK